MNFKNQNVLILGGMGFIGSNLSIRLSEMGANVTVYDAMFEEYGGNPFNIEPAREKIEAIRADIRDADTMKRAVSGKDFVFHCAAQVCHLKSLTDPFPDIDINIKGTAVVMEALRKHNPNAKIIKLGSRGQYGEVSRLPASEDVIPKPKGIYEISLLAAEHILSSYSTNHGIKCVLLRLTNIYGPRSQMKHNRYGVANWFIRLAIEDRTIPIFGNGSIKRDFLYVDDCVDAILSCAVSPVAEGQVVNIGDDKPCTFLEFAKTVIKAAGRGKWDFTPFSKERKSQEPGDFYSDISKLKKLTGWRTSTSLEEGIRRTVEYYEKNRGHYW